MVHAIACLTPSLTGDGKLGGNDIARLGEVKGGVQHQMRAHSRARVTYLTPQGAKPFPSMMFSLPHSNKEVISAHCERSAHIERGNYSIYQSQKFAKERERLRYLVTNNEQVQCNQRSEFGWSNFEMYRIELGRNCPGDVSLERARLVRRSTGSSVANY